MAVRKEFRHVFETARSIPAWDLLGAHLSEVEEGIARVRLPFRPDLRNSQGNIQGGILTAAADASGGWALLTLLPPGTVVATVEIKLNFLKPVKQDILAEGRVIRLGACLGISSLSVETASGKAAAGIATYFFKSVSREEGESDYNGAQIF